MKVTRRVDGTFTLSGITREEGKDLFKGLWYYKASARAAHERYGESNMPAAAVEAIAVRADALMAQLPDEFDGV